MDLEKEIRRIAEYQNSQLPKSSRRTEQAIDFVVSDTIKALKSHSYDFSKMVTISLNQDGKKRKIRTYNPLSAEEIICVFIKRVLDRKFHINYPNRNEFMHSLFDVTNALKDMIDYTVYRFDFEDFFNSVSAQYVFEKCIAGMSFERWELDLIKEYTDKTIFAYAGLNTSNIICEIIANSFDHVLIQKLCEHGLIYYKRYIDDGIMIFNQHLKKDVCTGIVNEVIQEVFFDHTITCERECKTRLNINKTQYVSKREMILTGSPCHFDFLGYLFELSNHQSKKHITLFKYGLTQSKIDKYQKRICGIIKEYAESPTHDQELLRHQIKCFSSRIVYQVTRYKTVIWKSKGFISNYCELGSRIDLLTSETKRFLKNAVFDAFHSNGVPLPYFMKGNAGESCYNLYYNLKRNRTMLFVQMIGIDYDTLQKMCNQIGIQEIEKTYDGMVRDYLIKVKVGH